MTTPTTSEGHPRQRGTRADGVYTANPRWSRASMVVSPTPSSLTASGSIPVAPPAEWFNDPELARLTPLTVDNSGRVYGHVAGWNVSHIGLAGSIKPPRSRSKYAFFKSGVLECEDGTQIDVGQITLAGGHAPLEASAASAVKHYDDTQSGVMDVAVGEDRHGIWIAGALRPSVTPEQIRSLRASGISGDWRPINGHLELVAICSVPVPGFPIPRARVASGAVLALVAAGSEPLVDIAMQRAVSPQAFAASAQITEMEAGMEALSRRLLRMERVVLDRAASTRMDPDMQAVVAAAAADQDSAREQLRQRVHKPEPLAASGDLRLAETLRARVHQTEIDEDARLSEN